jgi:acyl dehydratase
VHDPSDRTRGVHAPDAPSASDLDVRLLDSPPSIVGRFARGAVTGARRRGTGGTLPTQRLVLTGVEQDVRRLADYCEVTGGVLADRVPTTWLHVLTFPLQVSLMSGRDFPFPMLGLVHTANSMALHRPVRVEESLTLSSWAENLAPHRKGSTVDLVGEARVGDEVVWEGRSTYLARGSGSDDAPAREERHGIPERELAIWRLPADLGRRYAKVSGDANPIHVSALSAKAFGFPRAIAHGMWTHARVLASVQPRLPEAYAVDVQFLKPVMLPSSVVLRGAATTAQGADSELAVTSRDGSRVHLTAQIRAL